MHECLKVSPGPQLQLSEGGVVKIAACYPRAVKWLFHDAGAPLAEEGVEIHNMRTDASEKIVPLLLNGVEIPQEQTT